MINNLNLKLSLKTNNGRLECPKIYCGPLYKHFKNIKQKNQETSTLNSELHPTKSAIIAGDSLT